MDPATSTRSRLIDYFVEAVAVPHADHHHPHTPHDDDDAFTREIVRRVPETDHRDFPLPDGMPLFCLPACLSALNPPAYERKPTFFSFSLTGGDGSRAYGFALHFYELVTATASAAPATAEMWRPRVVCVVSHHPFFSLFKETVSWIYRSRENCDPQDLLVLPPSSSSLAAASMSAEARDVEALLAEATDQRKWFLSPRSTSQNMEHRPSRFIRTASDGGGSGAGPGLNLRYDRTKQTTLHDSLDAYAQHVDRILRQLVAHAVCPRPGGVLQIQLDGRAFFRYHVQRGNVAHLDDSCFQMLFQCLSLKNVLYIVNCMLLEQRILIHSNHHGLLTPVCEALCALLFPFTWEHVYVPFLPVKLIEYLQAPVPYLMGLHTSSLATRIGAEIFSSCVVVHLDKDKVVTPISSRIDDSPMDFVLARLPSHEVDVLLRAIAHVVPQPVNSSGSISQMRSPRKNTASPRNTVQHEPADNDVELTFGDGPLGITFESTHLRLLAVNNFEHGSKRSPSAVVKALPRLQNGLPGPAERSGLLRPGSFLVGINGTSTLDLTFEETIDRLRVEKRPVRLRFLNDERPHETACRFAERLQALSLVSAMQVDHSNSLFHWVDVVRSAFAFMFTSIFRDYQRYICIEHVVTPSGMLSPRTPSPRQRATAAAAAGMRRRRSSMLDFSVTFDHASFCACASAAATGWGFLKEFTQTQSFAGFVNDSVIGRVSHTDAYPQLELFKHCVHLFHELGDRAADAITLLFERAETALETLEFVLPREPAPQTLASLTTAFSSTDTSAPDAEAEAPSFSSFPSSTSISGNNDTIASPGSPVAVSPAKRTSKTRQLEMIICGARLEELELPTLAPDLLERLANIDVSAGECQGECDHMSSLASSGSTRSLLTDDGHTNSTVSICDDDAKTPTTGAKHNDILGPELDDELLTAFPDALDHASDSRKRKVPLPQPLHQQQH